jgi:AcrR family transcriptional regulator
MSDSAPSDPSPKRRRLSGEARRDAIVRGAAQLFSERGFAGSTREIATRLGVAQALLYRYFPSKHDLIEAVFQAFRETWGADRGAILHEPGKPLHDRILAFYAAYINRNRDLPGARLFMHAALAGIDLPLRYGVDLDAFVLRPVLSALRREAGLAPPLDPLPRDERDLVLGLHGAIVFVGIRRHIYGAKIDDARHLELVSGIIRAFTPGALAILK